MLPHMGSDGNSIPGTGSVLGIGTTGAISTSDKLYYLQLGKTSLGIDNLSSNIVEESLSQDGEKERSSDKLAAEPKCGRKSNSHRDAILRSYSKRRRAGGRRSLKAAVVSEDACWTAPRDRPNGVTTQSGKGVSEQCRRPSSAQRPEYSVLSSRYAIALTPNTDDVIDAISGRSKSSENFEGEALVGHLDRENIEPDDREKNPTHLDVEENWHPVKSSSVEQEPSPLQGVCRNTVDRSTSANQMGALTIQTENIGDHNCQARYSANSQAYPISNVKVGNDAPVMTLPGKIRKEDKGQDGSEGITPPGKRCKRSLSSERPILETIFDKSEGRAKEGTEGANEREEECVNHTKDASKSLEAPKKRGRRRGRPVGRRNQGSGLRSRRKSGSARSKRAAKEKSNEHFSISNGSTKRARSQEKRPFQDRKKRGRKRKRASEAMKSTMAPEGSMLELGELWELVDELNRPMLKKDARLLEGYQMNCRKWLPLAQPSSIIPGGADPAAREALLRVVKGARGRPPSGKVFKDREEKSALTVRMSAVSDPQNGVEQRQSIPPKICEVVGEVRFGQPQDTHRVPSWRQRSSGTPMDIEEAILQTQTQLANMELVNFLRLSRLKGNVTCDHCMQSIKRETDREAKEIEELYRMLYPPSSIAAPRYLRLRASPQECTSLAAVVSRSAAPNAVRDVQDCGLHRRGTSAGGMTFTNVREKLIVQSTLRSRKSRRGERIEHVGLPVAVTAGERLPLCISRGESCLDRDNLENEVARQMESTNALHQNTLRKHSGDAASAALMIAGDFARGLNKGDEVDVLGPHRTWRRAVVDQCYEESSGEKKKILRYVRVRYHNERLGQTQSSHSPVNNNKKDGNSTDSQTSGEHSRSDKSNSREETSSVALGGGVVCREWIPVHGGRLYPPGTARRRGVRVPSGERSENHPGSQKTSTSSNGPTLPGSPPPGTSRLPGARKIFTPDSSVSSESMGVCTPARHESSGTRSENVGSERQTRAMVTNIDVDAVKEGSVGSPIRGEGTVCSRRGRGLRRGGSPMRGQSAALHAQIGRQGLVRPEEAHVWAESCAPSPNHQMLSDASVEVSGLYVPLKGNDTSPSVPGPSTSQAGSPKQGSSQQPSASSSLVMTSNTSSKLSGPSSSAAKATDEEVTPTGTTLVRASAPWGQWSARPPRAVGSCVGEAALSATPRERFSIQHMLQGEPPAQLPPPEL